MEIKIDLREILTDEFGNIENLAETIKRQIVSNLTNSLAKGIQLKVNDEIAKLIDDQIKKVVECQMPSLFSELIDKEYTIVDDYGCRNRTTTMRNQLIKTLTDQMVYKKTQYSSEKTYFTKNIDAVVAQKMDDFKKQFNLKVDEVFTKEALDYAFRKMQEKLQ
uniref:Uncharacterized protein n=1 Tax=viral metagenome TaxID=1070528 RepID=A0A6M3JQY9_9ZZZZ